MVPDQETVIADNRARAVDDVLLLAGAFEGQGEDRINHRCPLGAGDNHGQLVEWWLGLVGLKAGQPWCMAFAQSMGVLALGKKTTEALRAWPLPLTGGCQWLYEWAKKYHPAIVVTAPERGDLFLLYEAGLKRYGHTGFVTNLVEHGCQTIEGNTNNDGSREGWKVLRKQRPLTGLIFVRWALLLG